VKTEQIALTLFTLRERMKTREDLEETLRRVKRIGYPAVQVSGLNWDIVGYEDFAGLCAELGLTICATHEASRTILDRPEQVVEKLQALGCRYTAYPHPGNIDLCDEDQVAAWIQQLDHAGKVLADAGLVLTYHNHHTEFRKLNGAIILERLYAETDPAHLQGEIDVYWVQHGGGNPVDWCRRLDGRLPLLHLKDFGINDRNEIEFREVGNGNLDFKAIVAAADAAGCEWFIVEQDICPGDEFGSIRQSFDYMCRELVA